MRHTKPVTSPSLESWENEGGGLTGTPCDTPASAILDAKNASTNLPIKIPFIDRAHLRNLHGKAALGLPSARKIENIMLKLEAFVLKGYRDDDIGDAYLAQQLEELLLPQISISQQFDGLAKAAADQQARRIVAGFARSLPAIIQQIDEDISFAYCYDPAATTRDIIPLCYNGITAIAIYRLANILWCHGEKRVSTMMSSIFAKERTGIDINPGATIGSPFFIDHGHGVVIGETATIGKSVRIYQGVTIGAACFSYESKDGELIIKRDPKRHPTIRDEVNIYANATILGGKTIIGHGATIGASSWVTRSIPAGYMTYRDETGETRCRPFTD